MKVFAVFNVKGGVGKTAAAVNLSYLSAAEGARTLLWDLDPQAAATYTLRVRPRVKGAGRKLIQGRRSLENQIRATDFRGLDLLPADFRYRKMERALATTDRPARQLAALLQPLAEHYDRLFLDCPPGLSLVAEAVLIASDVLLVPSIPTTLSMRTLEQLASHLERRRLRRLEVMPFFCQVDRRKRLHLELTAAGHEAVIPFLRSTIPSASVIERMSLHRAPVGDFAANTPAARAFAELWREISQRSGAASSGE